MTRPNSLMRCTSITVQVLVRGVCVCARVCVCTKAAIPNLAHQTARLNSPMFPPASGTISALFHSPAGGPPGAMNYPMCRKRRQRTTRVCVPIANGPISGGEFKRCQFTTSAVL